MGRDRYLSGAHLVQKCSQGLIFPREPGNQFFGERAFRRIAHVIFRIAHFALKFQFVGEKDAGQPD